MALLTFPVTIAYGSRVGPLFKTRVFEAESGFEQRNVVWEHGRFEADVGTGIQDQADLDTLIAFFRIVKGRAYPFRFKDWSDFAILNQVIGTGDGATTTYQLKKTYTISSDSIERTITHPVENTLLNMEVGGTPTVDFTVDWETGVVTFNTAPANGEAIIVGSCEFDIPCRFDTDSLQITLEAYQLGNWGGIPIREVRQ